MEAAFAGDLPRLWSLLDADRSLVWDWRNGLTALHIAAFAGQVEAADVLLLKGAEINASKGAGTALLQASLAGNEAVVEYLLANGADPNAASSTGETPLMAAAIEGY